MVSRYVFHIGYGKTGTTSIQRLLAANRKALLDQGVLYPDARAQGSWLRLRDHNMVGRALAGRRGWWGLSAEEFFAQFERQRREAKAHTVLLSAEEFLGAVRPWCFDDVDAYREAVCKMIDRLVNIISGGNVTIIAYLRRQDHWLESAMNQNIKFGALVGPHLASLSAEQAVTVYSPRLDYAAVLDMWAATFGKPKIDIGVYERSQLAGGDIVSDFLRRCGIERGLLWEPAWNQASQNEGLPRDLLEFKRVLNTIPRPKYEERALVEAFRRVAGDMRGRENDSVPLLSNNVRRQILQQYADGNAAVAREYLGREDGALFLEAWPQMADSDSQYPGLSTETAIEIELRLERHWRSFGNRLRLLRHWAAERLRRLPMAHAGARALRALALRAALGRHS